VLSPYPKKVWRHLVDGDMVLMNRQPTLHKPSIMAQEVRVLRTSSGGGVPRATRKPAAAIESGGGGGISAGQQTLRFHYANCKTFNADFDGDEMNMHFPQDYLAASEARFIASAPRQFVVPTTGHPLRGLIQDHISVGVLLTQRDRFFEKDLFCQLVFQGLQGIPTHAVPAGSPALIRL